jgi:hypothetical protein
MFAIEPGGIWKRFPSHFKALTHCNMSFEAAPQQFWSGNGIELAIFSHEAHQCLNVVAIPCSSKVLQHSHCHGLWFLTHHFSFCWGVREFAVKFSAIGQLKSELGQIIGVVFMVVIEPD